MGVLPAKRLAGATSSFFQGHSGLHCCLGRAPERPVWQEPHRANVMGGEGSSTEFVRLGGGAGRNPEQAKEGDRQGLHPHPGNPCAWPGSAGLASFRGDVWEESSPRSLLSGLASWWPELKAVAVQLSCWTPWQG